jgi:Domain of Unknown Function (DUF1080)
MTGFTTLPFDEASSWAQAGAGRFTPVAPGVLETHGGPGMLWYTAARFGDLALEVQWRCRDLEDNSGVFLRFPEAELRKERPDFKQGLEVQIDERGVDPEADRMDSPLHLTGAVYRLAPARVRASRPLGEWNTFHVELCGGAIRVQLNGVEVCVMEALPEDRPKVGCLGLQNHHAGSRVQFRAPRVRIPQGRTP